MTLFENVLSKIHAAQNYVVAGLTRKFLAHSENWAINHHVQIIKEIVGLSRRN